MLTRLDLRPNTKYRMRFADQVYLQVVTQANGQVGKQIWGPDGVQRLGATWLILVWGLIEDQLQEHTGVT